MKLITRLFILVGTTAFLFAAAVVAYFMVLSPVDTIQAEHERFLEAQAAVTNLQIQVGRLLTEPFGNQKPVYDQALKDYYAAIEAVGQRVVLLPTLSPQMAEAVQTILKLKDVTDLNVSDVDLVWQDLEKDAKDIFADVPSTYIMKFYGSQARRAAPELLDRAQSNVSTLTDAIQMVNAFLDTTAKTISEQYDLVGAEIERVRARSLQLIAILAGVFALLALVQAALMSRAIVRGIHQVMDNISGMASGDLTLRFHGRARGEVGQLGADLNRMMDRMQEAVGGIKAAAARNQAIRGSLTESVTRATSSAVEIEANTNSIRVQMERMDRMIESSTADMGRVGQGVAGFNERMARQDANISEAVAAVTQMLASIDSIARITETNRATTEILVRESEQGRSVFEDAFGKVTEIAESVGAIKEMATVIAGIATQTNILAMNAAIEAAHAGEFGKGFAVVADEISKLAAASAASSEEIAHTIKLVVTRFSEAAGTKQTTIDAFDHISARIQDVTRAVEEIYRNASEMRIGSSQVLEATQNIRSASSDITGESGRITGDISAVQHTFGEISRVSREVVSNISEITIGLHDITGGIHQVSALTDELVEVGSSLDAAVAQFRVEAADAAARDGAEPEGKAAG